MFQEDSLPFKHLKDDNDKKKPKNKQVNFCANVWTVMKYKFNI